MASWKVAYQNRKSFSKNLIGLVLTPLGFSMIARMTLRFSTLHGICTGCAKKAATRRLLTSPLILLTEFLALLSLIGFVAGGATMLIATQDDPPSQQLITIFCASLVSLPLMLWFRLRLRHSVIPKPLRIIAKRPIEFLGLAPI